MKKKCKCDPDVYNPDGTKAHKKGCPELKKVTKK